MYSCPFFFFDKRVLTLRLFVMRRGRFAVAPGVMIIIYKKNLSIYVCSVSTYGNDEMA